MKILALDLATKTGWAHSSGPSGVWDFSIRQDESDGMRAIRFATKLREIRSSLGFDVIAFERATGTPGRERATVTHAELQGVLKYLRSEFGFEYCGYSPAEIKKHATGKGNANKDAMIDAAKRRGWKVIDDNHCDALFILDLAKQDMGITERFIREQVA